MYQFYYSLITSLQKTIHNCSTETLTRRPADFPSIPTSWTIYSCYSNLDCSHLKFSTWFFSCNSNVVPYSEFPSYCQTCPLPSPKAVPACLHMAWGLFTAHFLHFFKECSTSQKALKFWRHFQQFSLHDPTSGLVCFFVFFSEATFLPWKSCS